MFFRYIFQLCVYKMNNSSPRTASCGTPHRSYTNVDREPPNCTNPAKSILLSKVLIIIVFLKASGKTPSASNLLNGVTVNCEIGLACFLIRKEGRRSRPHAIPVPARRSLDISSVPTGEKVSDDTVAIWDFRRWCVSQSRPGCRRLSFWRTTQSPRPYRRRTRHHQHLHSYTHEVIVRASSSFPCKVYLFEPVICFLLSVETAHRTYCSCQTSQSQNINILNSCWIFDNE